jgi:hypothetical protein
MKVSRVFFRTLLVCGLFAGAVLAAPPSLDAPDLASGPFSSMHMLLEKTVLSVDVLTVDVRVDKPTQERIAALATGKSYSDELGRSIAAVAIAAPNAVVQLEFKRDVSLSMWMGEVRKNLQQAKDAGLISAELQKKVSDGLPVTFKALESRGYKDGDRLIYRVKPGSVRTVVVGPDHVTTFIDTTDSTRDVRGVIMASYMAPGSDFRVPLLKSLFRG